MCVAHASTSADEIRLFSDGCDNETPPPTGSKGALDTTTAEPTPLFDGCNLIKCAHECHDECGWDSSLWACVRGGETNPQEEEVSLAKGCRSNDIIPDISGPGPHANSQDSSNNVATQGAKGGGPPTGVIVALATCASLLVVGVIMFVVCKRGGARGDVQATLTNFAQPGLGASGDPQARTMDNPVYAENPVNA